MVLVLLSSVGNLQCHQCTSQAAWVQTLVPSFLHLWYPGQIMTSLAEDFSFLYWVVLLWRRSVIRHLAQCLAHGKDLMLAIIVLLSCLNEVTGSMSGGMELGLEICFGNSGFQSRVGKAKAWDHWFVALGPGPVLTDIFLLDHPSQETSKQLCWVLMFLYTRHPSMVIEFSSVQAGQCLSSHTSQTHFMGRETESRKGKQSVWPNYKVISNRTKTQVFQLSIYLSLLNNGIWNWCQKVFVTLTKVNVFHNIYKPCMERLGAEGGRDLNEWISLININTFISAAQTMFMLFWNSFLSLIPAKWRPCSWVSEPNQASCEVLGL